MTGQGRWVSCTFSRFLESVTHRLHSWPDERRLHRRSNLAHDFWRGHPKDTFYYALDSNTFSELLPNLWDPVWTENAEPLIQKLRISTWWWQRINQPWSLLNTGPGASTGCRRPLPPTAPRGNKGQKVIPLLPLPSLPHPTKKEKRKNPKGVEAGTQENNCEQPQ